MTQTPETLRHHQNFWWAGAIDWQANPPMGKPETRASSLGSPWWRRRKGIPASCAVTSTHAPPPNTHSFKTLKSSSTEVPFPPLLSLLLRSFRKIGFYVAIGVLTAKKESPNKSFKKFPESVHPLCCTNFIWFCFLKAILWARCHR